MNQYLIKNTISIFRYSADTIYYYFIRPHIWSVFRFLFFLNSFKPFHIDQYLSIFLNTIYLFEWCCWCLCQAAIACVTLFLQCRRPHVDKTYIRSRKPLPSKSVFTTLNIRYPTLKVGTVSRDMRQTLWGPRWAIANSTPVNEAELLAQQATSWTMVSSAISLGCCLVKL